jgi:peptide/nickel transport system ATP-binding protein
MIAMALASKPSILLCDEPTTALDVTIQNQVLHLIAQAQRDERLALVYVTHDLAVVRQVCDRVAVMYASHLVEMGDCDDVLSRPRHPYTRALLGAVPDLDAVGGAFEPIPGSPPNLWSPPPGCRFHPRCPRGEPDCREGTFPLMGAGTHRSACRPIESGRAGVPVTLGSGVDR